MIRTRRGPDGSLEAVAEVVVGTETRKVVVPLGLPTREVDAGGLRNTPVVVLTDAALVDAIRVGAERAGRASTALLHLPSRSTLGAGLLDAAAIDEVVTILVPAERAVDDALIVARALGGRPLPVVPLDDTAAARRMLGACWIDLDVAIPSVDDVVRERARAAASELGLFVRHHVVEVDPRPGLDPEGPSEPTLHELAAASTGVLAGRIAAGNRRWR